MQDALVAAIPRATLAIYAGVGHATHWEEPQRVTADLVTFVTTDYAAITRNAYGKGEITYIGFMPSDAMIEALLTDTAKRAGVAWPEAARFPLIVRSGTLTNGNRVRYLLNYSREKRPIPTGLSQGTDLLSGKRAGSTLEPWAVAIVEIGD